MNLKEILTTLFLSMVAIFATVFIINDNLILSYFNISKSKKQDIIAKIERTQNNVLKKSVDSIDWGVATKKSDVYQNDMVFTGDQSFADINLKNQQKIKMSPNTIIRFSNLDNNNEIVINRGQIQGALKNLRIRLARSNKVIKASSEKIQIKVKDDNIIIKTEDKNSKIEIDDEVVEIKTTEKVILSKIEKKIIKEKLNFSLLSPINEALYNYFVDSTIQVAWETGEENSEFEIYMAKDQDFKNVLVKDTIEGKRRFQIPTDITSNEVLYIKVIERINGKIRGKQTVKVNIDRNLPFRIISPSSEDEDQYNPFTLPYKTVSFRWENKVDSPFTYHFKLFDKNNVEVFKRKTDSVELRVGLKKGIYKWVVGVSPSYKEGIDDIKWSRPRDLKISEKYQNNPMPIFSQKLEDFIYRGESFNFPIQIENIPERGSSYQVLDSKNKIVSSGVIEDSEIDLTIKTPGKYLFQILCCEKNTFFKSSNWFEIHNGNYKPVKIVTEEIAIDI